MLDRPPTRDSETEDGTPLQALPVDDLDEEEGRATARRALPLWERPSDWLRRAGQFFFLLSFSSLTRRIVSLNLAGLIALVASILYLSQFRAGLIDARAQSLLVQAEIIAGAIAASATVETNAITVDPERLAELKPGESYGPQDDFSGLDFPINPERVAPVLRRLLTTLVTVANETSHSNNVRVQARFEGPLSDNFAVPGHDSRLGQVVANLLSNAQSFSKSGGMVHVTCRRSRNRMVDIVVDDDGPGIRPGALEKIFERFYTDRPDQGFGQNSGLGLSISKQIVDAHGGRIWAENRAGRTDAEGDTPIVGARFTVRLPAL